MMRDLRLAALAEEDHVVAGQERVLDLRDDRLVEADDAGQQRLAAAPACASRLRRISSRTGRTVTPAARNSPRVPGRVAAPVAS